LRALLACPTGSIGTLHPDRTRAVRADFPIPLEDGVSYCGFNSPKSFGGNSYFVERPGGNWLIDSPKYLPHMIDQFDRRGGIAHIFSPTATMWPRRKNTPRDFPARASFTGWSWRPSPAPKS
jgi:hypothetical protein